MSYSKYRARKTIIDGVVFDSHKEAQRYIELLALSRAGEISNLQLQVPYILINKSKYGRSIKYIADFVYYEDGNIIVEDVKGVRTPLYKLKKRLFEEKYDMKIKEI